VDENGQALSNGDPTDWRSDDVWASQESELFSPSLLPLCSSLPDSMGVFAAPNPCKNVLGLGFLTPAGATWRFRIVDENFKLLKEYDWVNPMPYYNYLQVKTDDFPKDTVRVYYRVERAGCVWRGHGDVVVTQ
jgi:hypothetical protein